MSSSSFGLSTHLQRLVFIRLLRVLSSPLSIFLLLLLLLLQKLLVVFFVFFMLLLFLFGARFALVAWTNNENINCMQQFFFFSPVQWMTNITWHFLVFILKTWRSYHAFPYVVHRWFSSSVFPVLDDKNADDEYASDDKTRKKNIGYFKRFVRYWFWQELRCGYIWQAITIDQSTASAHKKKGKRWKEEIHTHTFTRKRARTRTKQYKKEQQRTDNAKWTAL